MSLFTVEQLELIRRLRTTGITSEQVQQAFLELDQVDCDLAKGHQMSAKVTKSLATMPNRSSSTSEPESEPKPTTTQTSSSTIFAPLLMQHLSSPPASSASMPSPHLYIPTTERLSVLTVPMASTGAGSPPPPPLSLPTSTATATTTTPPSTSSPVSLGSGFDTTTSAGGRPPTVRSQRTPLREITTLDDPGELDEFMVLGEEACIADMKNFITQYSLRQTTVAMMTGVSQPYISKLLNGNHRELSLRCRKNIYCWYLNCRRHPEKLASFLADPSTRLETNGDGELVPQRRERYVFRPILIRMLEGFFAQTPFPDLPRRVEIATACNHILQLDKKGVGLMPKEVVSPQVVSNWFANKRKELRRRSQENGGGCRDVVGGVAVASPPRTPDDVHSMSPPSRDDEHMSTREASPANDEDGVECVDVATATTSSSPLPQSSSLSSSFAPQLHVDLLAVAQRLGLQMPMPATSTSTTPPSPLALLLHTNPHFLQQLGAFQHPNTMVEPFSGSLLSTMYDRIRTPVIKLE